MSLFAEETSILPKSWRPLQNLRQLLLKYLGRFKT